MWRRTWLGRRERGAPLGRSSISFWRRAGISSHPAVSASAGGAEERAKNVEVEHVLRGPPGAEQWLEARPRDERGGRDSPHSYQMGRRGSTRSFQRR
ncbi:hypothetical protein [Pyrobaculum sp.]|uniref:hypothetical protein n=1 Tax=Pyrobaculum sp. TaxID=2004705 RepID=UPI0031736FC5